MNGSPKEPALSIENVEFVKNDESKRRSNKKKKRNKSGSADEHALNAPPMSSPGRDLPLYAEEQGEMNPLLGTSPSRGYVPIHYGPQQQQYPGAEYYNYGYPVPGQQQPPSPPQAYPPMMNMPPNTMYQYYDPMGAPMFHPVAGQQQPVPSSPQSMQQHFNGSGNHRRTRSPHSQQRQGRRSPAASPPPHQIRKSYPDSPDGAEHPLKKSSQMTEGGGEYEIPLRDSGPEQSYGAIPDSTTPPRSSRSKGPKPPRRKSDTIQRPPSPLTGILGRAHRRVSSDSKFGRHRRVRSSDRLRPTDSEPAGGGKHRRSSSDRLPPTGLGRLRKNLNPYPANRRRSYSGGAPNGRPRPTHVRTSSLGDTSIGASVATSTSMVSHVSDISRSAFFGGTTETGKVQLHFPFENIRLTMDDALPTGVLYMRHVDDEQYEDYHILNDEHSVPWDLDIELPCQCTCHKCIGCTERNQQLAPSHYIMTVEDDLYRRIFDEINASRSMPCGLFFCGHHEDVSHPSILIAGTIVVLFIGALVVATMMTSA